MGHPPPVALPILRGSVAPSLNGRDDCQARRRMTHVACRSARCKVLGVAFGVLPKPLRSFIEPRPIEQFTDRPDSATLEARQPEPVKCSKPVSFACRLSLARSRKLRLHNHLQKPRAQTTSALPPKQTYAAQNTIRQLCSARSQKTLQIKVFPNTHPPK